MSLTNKQKVFLGLYSAWTTLGFRRGYLHYKYKHEEQMKRYLEDKNANKPYATNHMQQTLAHFIIQVQH